MSKQASKSWLKGFSLLVIVLLVGLQFLSGCGGCGGGEEEDATAGVEGDACPDVNKVTVDAYGVHYPCDMCSNPVTTETVNYTECGTGYMLGDVKSYKDQIACTTSGTHSVSYTEVKHGEKKELGFSSFKYDTGAGAVAFDNSTDNPPINGCVAAGITECASPFLSSYYKVTQWGVNIVWPCSGEQTSDLATPYTTDSKATAGTYGYEKGLEQEFKRTFKCPDCITSGDWTYGNGDRFLVVIKAHSSATAPGIEYCVYTNPDPNPSPGEENLVNPAYARFSYEIWTSNANMDQLTQLVASTDEIISTCQ